MAWLTVDTIWHEDNGEAQTFGGVQCHHLDGVYDTDGIFAGTGVVRTFSVMLYEPAEAQDVFVGTICSGAFVIGDGLAQAAKVVHLYFVLVCMKGGIGDTQEHEYISV